MTNPSRNGIHLRPYNPQRLPGSNPVLLLHVSLLPPAERPNSLHRYDGTTSSANIRRKCDHILWLHRCTTLARWASSPGDQRRERTSIPSCYCSKKWDNWLLRRQYTSRKTRPFTCTSQPSTSCAEAEAGSDSWRQIWKLGHHGEPMEPMILRAPQQAAGPGSAISAITSSTLPPYTSYGVYSK